MATKKPKDAGKTPNPTGRPSNYFPEYADQAYKLCLLGATDKKLADFFGVSEQTINAWKSAHPHFLESITRGKEIADAEIAESLFHRAKGYSHPDVDIKVIASEVVKTPLTKHYPPDTAAASLWLRNRQPALWRDKVDVNHSGTIGLRQAQDMTDDELAAIAAGSSAGTTRAQEGEDKPTRVH